MGFQRSFFSSAILATSCFLCPLIGQEGVLKAEVLSLPDAIRQALANNYQIKAAALGTGITDADLDAEWGAFHPGLQARVTSSDDGSPVSTDPFSGDRPPASVVETDSYSVGVGGRTPIGTTYSVSGFSQNRRGTFNNFASNYYSFGGLEVTQPLLKDFGLHANLVGVRLASASHESARWRYRASVMNTVTLVINAYLELDFANKRLATAETSRGLAQSLLDENIKRARAGDLSQADVISAETRVAGREEAILLARRGVLVAANALKQLISSDTSAALLSRNMVIAEPPLFPDHSPDPAVEIGPALERRPDYQQAIIDVDRTDINRRYRKNQLLPSLDLVGSLGYNGLDGQSGTSWDNVRNRESRSYSLGAVVSIPLTFAVERGRYRSAKLAQQQAEMALAGVEQNIVVDIGNAASQIETAKLRVAATQKSYELAVQNLDAELKKLRAGTGDTFFVLTQQEVLANTQISVDRAQTDLQLALAEYDRQMGITLDRHAITIEGDAETSY
ncbi:MAG: TolC family protein [Synoicihabitans sp.]